MAPGLITQSDFTYLLPKSLLTDPNSTIFIIPSFYIATQEQ